MAGDPGISTGGLKSLQETSLAILEMRTHVMIEAFGGAVNRHQQENLAIKAPSGGGGY